MVAILSLINNNRSHHSLVLRDTHSTAKATMPSSSRLRNSQVMVATQHPTKVTRRQLGLLALLKASQASLRVWEPCRWVASLDLNHSPTSNSRNSQAHKDLRRLT
jgi:hypothetical protein